MKISYNKNFPINKRWRLNVPASEVFKPETLGFQCLEAAYRHAESMQRVAVNRKAKMPMIQLVTNKGA